MSQSTPVHDAPLARKPGAAARSRSRVARGVHDLIGEPLSPTELRWLLVVHPNPEIAAGRADLVRLACPEQDVLATSRATDALRARQRCGPSGIVLMHMEGVDRFQWAWGGHRTLPRLAALGGLEAVAWVGADDRDAVALATSLGTRIVQPPPPHELDPTARVAQLKTLTRPEQPRDPTIVMRPDRGADARLAAWFLDRYGRPWQPWFEQVAAVIVAGGERAEQAEALLLTAGHPSVDLARRWLRSIADILCGDMRSNEAVLRREAMVVLRRIARERPIAAEAVVACSLQRAAAQLAADPTLTIEAGLTADEARDLAEVAAEEAEVAVGGVRRRERPEAGAWRLRRDLALGRVAERRGRTAAEKLDALEELRVTVADGAAAIHDALEDRERPTPFSA